jgi:hypothetical protein
MRGVGTTVTLPGLGIIRAHEPAGVLASLWMSARILSATVSCTAQRWFGSFAVEVERPSPIVIPGPRPLPSALQRLHRAARVHSCKQQGSTRRRRSTGRRLRLYARITDLWGTPRSQLRGHPLRLDALHQATSDAGFSYETVAGRG